MRSASTALSTLTVSKTKSPVEMLTIGRLFQLKLAHPEGCYDCGRILFEDDLVGYVNGNLTCNDPCILRIKAADPLYRKAANHKNTEV